MNSFKRPKTTESGDIVYTEYKGKTFAIPRSEYKKPLQTIPGQPSLASTLTSETSQPAPCTNLAQHKPTNDSFSLGALTESRKTLQNAPTATPSTRTIISTKGDQPPAAIADSLLQLKSSVVDLIDKTISDIETKQQQQEKQAALPPSEGATAVFLHPGGDSPKTEVAQQHRVQNLQVLKTESFAQSKREVRKKLYREIEAILVRLKDMDFLE
uniref:Uncharacterized protein n=1 Tax=Culex tarsalis TaxID=7177 RepID=A0A1Q3G032_CULTA